MSWKSNKKVIKQKRPEAVDIYIVCAKEIVLKKRRNIGKIKQKRKGRKTNDGNKKI